MNRQVGWYMYLLSKGFYTAEGPVKEQSRSGGETRDKRKRELGKKNRSDVAYE